MVNNREWPQPHQSRMSLNSPALLQKPGAGLPGLADASQASQASPFRQAMQRHMALRNCDSPVISAMADKSAPTHRIISPINCALWSIRLIRDMVSSSSLVSPPHMSAVRLLLVSYETISIDMHQDWTLPPRLGMGKDGARSDQGAGYG